MSTLHPDPSGTRPIAVVTGASSGIGLALAREFADHGYDLVVAAEDTGIDDAAEALRPTGAHVVAVRADLGTYEGVEALATAALAGPPPAALAVNAGIGVSGSFLDADLRHHLDLIALNVTGAVHLTHRLLPALVRSDGKVLFTSSIAATMPGPYESTYAASKAFLYSFAEAIRHELRDTGVTVTALMPGPTDTEFFERAGMQDTKVGQSPKDDPAEVARDGFEALMAGKDHVVAGSLKNRALAGAAKALPGTASAAVHGSMAEPRPGTAPDRPSDQ
jgi:uncharacterized protein